VVSILFNLSSCRLTLHVKPGNVSTIVMPALHVPDELALAQSPIQDEDLIIHILSQLGDEFNNIVAAIKIREPPISYSELFDKLTDFERMLKDNDSSLSLIIATANYTQTQNAKYRQPSSQKSFQADALHSAGLQYL
nr:zinc finger, CCHC-type [Tanacetum cinerariifolium]